MAGQGLLLAVIHIYMFKAVIHYIACCAARVACHWHTMLLFCNANDTNTCSCLHVEDNIVNNFCLCVCLLSQIVIVYNYHFTAVQKGGAK